MRCVPFLQGNVWLICEVMRLGVDESGACPRHPRCARLGNRTEIPAIQDKYFQRMPLHQLSRKVLQSKSS